MKTKKNDRAAKPKTSVAASKKNPAKPKSNNKPDRQSDGVKESPAVFSKSLPSLPKRGSLETFLVDGLKDMFWAEKHMLRSLLKMEGEATSDELRQAFKDHRMETEDHVSRLEEIFEMLDEKAEEKKCEAIEGITKEVERTISETRQDNITCDVALILGGQKAEHYEIASYSGLIELAMLQGTGSILFGEIGHQQEHPPPTPALPQWT